MGFGEGPFYSKVKRVAAVDYPTDTPIESWFTDPVGPSCLRHMSRRVATSAPTVIIAARRNRRLMGTKA